MRNQLQIGVPIDDTTTWHVTYDVYIPPPGVIAPEQTSSIAYVDVPLKDENGEWVLDCVLSQDMVAWWSQGPLTDRSVEHLATTDVVVIGYRNLLKEQIELVQKGGEPMNVFRDPAKNRCIEFELAPQRQAGSQFRNMYHVGTYINDDQERHSPDLYVIKEMMRQAAELEEAGGR